MHNDQLQSTVRLLMAKGKGILAADESVASADKRLSDAGIVPSPEARREYRELFIDTKGAEQYLSGIILHDETMRQEDSTGKPFLETLKEKGIVIGIKVDKGLVDLPGFAGEQVTEGLDALAGRLAEYYALGARFAKWRAVYSVSEIGPSEVCLAANSHAMARYALLCQAAGMVPVVEPEVLLEGSHTIAQAEKATHQALQVLMDVLRFYQVDLSGTILKTSMVLPGALSPAKAAPQEVARATVRTLKNSLPKDLGGVVFLSGGQVPEEAAQNLGAIARLEPLPWELAFSFARAIQGPALEVWRGQKENFPIAREKFIESLKVNTAADQGKL